MKSTGISRRIDELGRIVIPKEIRKNLKIRDGETLEIFIEEDNIILKKYSIMNDMFDVAQKCSDSMYEVIDKNIIITDRDKVIAASGSLKKKYLNKEIGPFLEEVISRRESYSEKYKKEIEIIEGEKEEYNYVVSSIIINGDSVGVVIILSKEEISEIEEKTTNFISKFLSKNLE